MAKYNKTDVQVGDTVKSDVNVQLGLIETAISDSLSRKGDVPNAMEADLDLNSNDILNAKSVSTTSLLLNGVVATASLSSSDLTANYAWTGTHSWTQDTTFGNILVTGLVDGRDIAVDGTKLDWISVTQAVDLDTMESDIATKYDATNINTAVVPINAQTGTTYTTVIGDAGSMVTLSNATAIACTIPPNASVAYPIGTVITFNQLGAGQVTLTAGAGVTLNTEVGLLTSAQHASASALKILTDTWIVTGSLSA